MAAQPPNSFGLRLNLWTLRLSRNWLRLALIVIGIYASLPWAAPALMRLGLEGPGRLLYTLYSPFCHQFSFRSFFLFGEQAVYPRSSTGMAVVPFESFAVHEPEFIRIYQDYVERYTGVRPEMVTQADLLLFSVPLQLAARDFVGSPQMGYKMTLCERDIAIYTGLLVGGIIYSRIRRRLRPVPIGLYILLGLGPIAVDGLSQMLGYPPFNLWPPRETLPSFRVVTGAIFGLMNAWLAFPYLEMSFQDTRRQIETKLAQRGIGA